MHQKSNGFFNKSRQIQNIVIIYLLVCLFNFILEFSLGLFFALQGSLKANLVSVKFTV